MGHWIQVREEMTRYQKVPSSPPFACFWDLSLGQETKSQQSMQDQNQRQKWSQLESCVWKTWVETYVYWYLRGLQNPWSVTFSCSTKMSKAQSWRNKIKSTNWIHVILSQDDQLNQLYGLESGGHDSFCRGTQLWESTARPKSINQKEAFCAR